MGQQVVRRMGQMGTTIHVVHDLDGNRLAEYEIDHLTGAQTLLQEYIWFDGVPVAVVDGQTDEVFFVRTDHIGRPVFATDVNGVKVWEASYLPFGGVHVSTGDVIDLRFPGQWFHTESGLHQNWMRDYDPTSGRYMQADPLGLVDGASVYGYVRQNPGRYVDPTGQCPWCMAAAIGVAVGAAANLFDQLVDGNGDFDCVNWWRVGLSGLTGGATGAGIGAGFKLFGASTGGSRPTYSLLRKNNFVKTKLGLRFENHPIRRYWPNWANYPHFHFSKFGKLFDKRHLPLVEPIVAIETLLSDSGCDCNNDM